MAYHQTDLQAHGMPVNRSGSAVSSPLQLQRRPRKSVGRSRPFATVADALYEVLEGTRRYRAADLYRCILRRHGKARQIE